MADNKIIEFVNIPESLTASKKNFLISTIRNAWELYGDSQPNLCKYIYECLHESWGGHWSVIICPKEEKSYNAHFHCLTNSQNEDELYYLVR